MNPYRTIERTMSAWPLWAMIFGGWIIAFAGTGSPAMATLYVLGVIGAIAALAALCIVWCLLEAWLRDQADAWDERKRTGVTSNVPCPPNNRS